MLSSGCSVAAGSGVALCVDSVAVAVVSGDDVESGSGVGLSLESKPASGSEVLVGVVVFVVCVSEVTGEFVATKFGSSDPVNCPITNRAATEMITTLRFFI